jgi:Trk-type K+ transport systems, membrane components
MVKKFHRLKLRLFFSFIAIYITFFLLFLFVLIFQNIDFYSAFSGTAAAINNLGPGLGQFAENYSSLTDSAKLTLAGAMIVGRLELFGVLILLFPSYWKS